MLVQARRHWGGQGGNAPPIIYQTCFWRCYKRSLNWQQFWQQFILAIHAPPPFQFSCLRACVSLIFLFWSVRAWFKFPGAWLLGNWSSWIGKYEWKKDKSTHESRFEIHDQNSWNWICKKLQLSSDIIDLLKMFIFAFTCFIYAFLIVRSLFTMLGWFAFTIFISFISFLHFLGG